MEILGISHYFWSGAGLIIAIILSVCGRRFRKALDPIYKNLEGCGGGSPAEYVFCCVEIPTFISLSIIYYALLFPENVCASAAKFMEFIIMMYISWAVFLSASFIFLIISWVDEMPRTICYRDERIKDRQRRSS